MRGCRARAAGKVPPAERNRPMKATLAHYFQLTKPSIMLLVVFTGTASLVIEGSLLDRPGRFLLVLLGLYLAGGSANALNQYFERNIDAQMKRTSGRRPLPRKQISPAGALVFSVAIGVLGVAVFALFFNLRTAALALATILFYSLFYTLYLKPTTPQNIVIGGIAGAMAPVGAWTAATGAMAVAPWIMFAIVFLWTPPHFWALALYCKDDYEKVDLPMLPLVKGDRATVDRIFAYTLAVVGASLVLIAFTAGWFYFAVAALLGGQFIRRAARVRREQSVAGYRSLFGYSIVYLFSLFGAMMADGVLQRWL
ncbi:MAG TPA: heme o synthase [candidate division Zixibacteria bacterium]|nr:heme o synthase [candidate division Zixibacteria bacterium]